MVQDSSTSEFNDDDSTLADKESSRRLSSAWASSHSVIRQRLENGRRYHRYREGSYMLPNDQREQDRLDISHQTFLIIMEGKLFFAPIDTEKVPCRVLDIGTGTGIWAIDMIQQYPRLEVIGTDLSAIQPPVGLPNLSFDVDDMESDWIYPPNHFDFIHARVLIGSIKDWPGLMAQAYKHLAPGGWIEFQESGTRAFCDDGSYPQNEDTALERWTRLLNDSADLANRPFDIAPKLKQLITTAGFQNVKEVVMRNPLNTWPTDEDDKELGRLMQINMLEGLEGFSMALFTRILGWSAQEVKELLVDVEKDIRNTDYHIYSLSYSVFGQKPYDA